MMANLKGLIKIVNWKLTLADFDFARLVEALLAKFANNSLGDIECFNSLLYS